MIAIMQAYWSVRGLDVYQVGAVDAGGELSILSTDVALIKCVCQYVTT